MNGALLISGFLMGAAGSLHCAGMCGPLCIMLPLQNSSHSEKIMIISVYQLGRIITYGIFGLLLGILGRRFYLGGYQQWFSLTLGSLVLLLAVLYFFAGRIVNRPINNYELLIQKIVVSALGKAGSLKGSFLLGMTNGLLPCGMVYMAILAALSFTTIEESVLFMSLFGLGTFPLMFATAWAGHKFKIKNQLALQQFIPAFIIAAGCLLILRGLNLGIPFISPQLLEAHGGELNCAP